MSHYLFLLCVEALSHSLNNAAANDNIEGFRINATVLTITQLLFADDRFFLQQIWKRRRV